MPSAQIIVDAKIPAISTCSSSPTLPITGHGYIFANAVTDNVQGAAQATYAYETGYRKAYLLQSHDIEYTLMPSYFASAFKKLGGEVVGESNYALEPAGLLGRGDEDQADESAAGRDRDLGVRAGLPGLHPAAARRRREDSHGGRRRHRLAHDLRARRHRGGRGVHLVRLRRAGQPDGGLSGEVPGQVRQAAGVDHGRARL